MRSPMPRIGAPRNEAWLVSCDDDMETEDGRQPDLGACVVVMRESPAIECVGIGIESASICHLRANQSRVICDDGVCACSISQALN